MSSRNNHSTSPWAQVVWPWPCERPSTVELTPVAQVDRAVIDPEIEQRLNFINASGEAPQYGNRGELVFGQRGNVQSTLYPPGRRVGRVPLHKAPGIKPKAGLFHPRPVKKIALKDALARFELMANGSNGCPGLATPPESSPDGYVTCPSSPRVDKGHVSEVPAMVHGPAHQLDVKSLPLRCEAKANKLGSGIFSRPAAFAPAVESAPVRPARGSARLSPGFLQNFERVERPQPRRPIFTRMRIPPAPRREPTPPPSPRSDRSSSPEATYVRGHHIARLVAQYGDIFVERDDAAPVDPNAESDSSWYDEELDGSVLENVVAAVNRSSSTDGDESVRLDLSMLSISEKAANEDSYLADEESISDSPRSSLDFSRFSSPVFTPPSSPDSFIFSGPTIRLVPPSNVPPQELPDLPSWAIEYANSRPLWSPRPDTPPPSPVAAGEA